jgi:phage shock protein E
MDPSAFLRSTTNAERSPMLRRAVQSPALILLLLLPLVGACAAASSDPETITPRELLERMGTDDAPIVLDVRSPFEFRMGHVPGAYNLEDRQVPSRIQELKQLADREIVVYCEVGPRARWVESYLKQNGFTKVRHLQGDFAGWQRSGHPVQ